MLFAFLLVLPITRARGQIPVQISATFNQPGMIFHEDYNGHQQYGKSIDCTPPLSCNFTTDFNDVRFSGTGNGLLSGTTASFGLSISQSVTYLNPNIPPDTTHSGNATGGFGNTDFYANVAPSAQLTVQVIDAAAASWSNAGVMATFEVDVPNGNPGQSSVCSAWSASAPNLWPNVMNGTGNPTDNATRSCPARVVPSNSHNGLYWVAGVVHLGGQTTVTDLSPGGSNASYSLAVTVSVFVDGPMMQINGGDGQTGATGAALPSTLTVGVYDGQTGVPVSGSIIGFTVVGPGGVDSEGAFMTPVSSMTDSKGLAGAILTLGSSTGTYTVTASCSQCMGNPTLNFTETAVPNLQLRKVSGDGNEGAISGPLLNPFVTRVYNASTQSPEAGHVVTFDVKSAPVGGGMVLSPASAVSDDFGIASASGIFTGAAGAYVVRALCADCVGNTEVDFTATAGAGPKWSNAAPSAVNTPSVSMPDVTLGYGTSAQSCATVTPSDTPQGEQDQIVFGSLGGGFTVSRTAPQAGCSGISLSVQSSLQSSLLDDTLTASYGGTIIGKAAAHAVLPTGVTWAQTGSGNDCSVSTSTSCGPFPSGCSLASSGGFSCPYVNLNATLTSPYDFTGVPLAMEKENLGPIVGTSASCQGDPGPFGTIQANI